MSETFLIIRSGCENSSRPRFNIKKCQFFFENIRPGRENSPCPIALINGFACMTGDHFETFYAFSLFKPYLQDY